MNNKNIKRIEADYLIETAADPQKVAEIMAGEQSSGTFRPVPHETQALKTRAAANVECVKIIGSVEQPSLNGAILPRDHKKWRQAHVTLSWPFDNLGPSLPNLITTIAGNLFELKQLSGIRLVDIRLPASFSRPYAGPKF